MVPIAVAIEFENIEHGWLWLVALIAGVVLLLYTYRGIFERSGQRIVWGLLLLRIAGLAALVLALARPVWTLTSELVDPGRVAVVLDDSQSMSLAAAGGSSRYAAATAAAGRLQKSIQSGSGVRMTADIYDLSGRLLGEKVPDEPRGERTDLAGSIRQVVSRLRNHPLVAVVLISDGADNTGTDAIGALSDLAVPVYTVGFQPDAQSGRMDLAIQEVVAPERVMVNNELNVEVMLSKTAGPAVEANVALKRGRETFITQKVPLGEGNQKERVTLKLAPREAGSFVYTAVVGAEPGEQQPANNARHFPLRVDADAIRVLYIEGFLRYEFKYLKNRLEDDPDISLVSVVRRASPEQSSGDAAGQLITPDRLASLEVVILGDMEGTYLAGTEYAALSAWINDGHGLLVLGGYHSFGPQGFRTTPLAETLPIVFADEPPQQSEDPFVLELTDVGRNHPIFQISGDRVQDVAMWSTAPHLAGSSIVKRAKPGADVLAVNPSVVSDGGPAVVVAAQRYGAGHTLVVAADTTWRWSRLVRVAGRDDTLFSRFWSQTIRWLAGRAVNDERPPLVVSTDRPDYKVGQSVVIRALRQPSGRSGGQPHAAAGPPLVEVISEAGKSMTIDMRTNLSEPDAFAGVFYPTSGGRYEVHASLAAQSNDQSKGQSNVSAAANHASEFLVHGSNLELAEAMANPGRMQAIARATGGVYVDVGEAQDLLSKIERRERRLARVVRTELWNKPSLQSGLFAFFLAAVTLEWVIRRRNHLV